MRIAILYCLLFSSVIYAVEVQKKNLKCHPLDEKDILVECDNDKVYQKESLDYRIVQKSKSNISETRQIPNKQENDYNSTVNIENTSSTISK